MAMQNFANRYGTLLTPALGFPYLSMIQGTIATLSAADHSAAAIGRIMLSTGPGSTKTLNAGGKIHFVPGTTTFLDVGTTLRIGVNDVLSTGLEDGTHAVFDDLVGGTDTITPSVVNTATMSSGSKSITHGDMIAIVMEMTAKGGSDSIVAVGSVLSYFTPYGTLDSGSGPTKVNGTGPPRFTIEFGDGTLGWFQAAPAFITEAGTAFGSGSSPNEYALVFEVPFKAAIGGLWLASTAIASTDNFEMILYSDPLGTPVAERTVAYDADFSPTNGIYGDFPLTSAYIAQPNTKYAVALKPTTINTIGFLRSAFNTGNGNLRGVSPLGTNWSQYQRTTSGAFASEDTTKLPHFGVWLSQLSDDVGGGGGGPLLNGRLIQ